MRYLCESTQYYQNGEDGTKVGRISTKIRGPIPKFLFYLIFSVKGKSIISICSWKALSSCPIAPARSSRSAGAAPTAAACAAAATAPASHLIPAVRRLAVRIRPATTPDGPPTPNALPAAGMRTRMHAHASTAAWWRSIRRATM